jgi:hypothetical protein
MRLYKRERDSHEIRNASLGREEPSPRVCHGKRRESKLAEDLAPFDLKTTGLDLLPAK